MAVWLGKPPDCRVGSDQSDAVRIRNKNEADMWRNLSDTVVPFFPFSTHVYAYPKN
jgi:hypothetical protein